MKKMESNKSRRPRWLDSFLGPKNSNSKWLQENLEEMNRNVRRMLKIIEDSDADSFANKVEMYYLSRQELINLVEKCYRIHCSLAERYNHGTGELLNNFPNSGLIRSQGRDISISSVSSGKSSAIQSSLSLSKFLSSKQLNAHERSVSKQLKRLVSGKLPMVGACVPRYSESQSDDDDDEEELQHEGTDDLEAELPDMIEKLYIEQEEKRVVSKLQDGILRYDNTHDDDDEFRKVKESVSSNVDKALLDENFELKCNMSYLEEISYLEEYNEEINKHDEEELQHEGTDDLEAELRDMIEKLYIEQEEKRVVSMLEDGILRYEDNTRDDDDDFRKVKESVSSNVDKALLEENLELQGEISRLLKEMSYLEEYNEEINERCESLEEALIQARAERIEAETLLASEVEQLKANIVKKNNNVEELNKILEAVVAERNQLKARVAKLDADP